MAITDMPPGYWADYEDDLVTILTTNIGAIAEHSIQASLEAAGTSVDDVGQDLLSRIRQEVGTMTREQAEKYADQIRKVTQMAVQEKIQAWYESGDRTVQELREELEPYFGKPRARRIATTEITRAYANHNLAVWSTLEYIVGKRWMTAMDDIVCPICMPLHGEFYELDNDGFIGIGNVGIPGPPAHVNCRCYLQPVHKRDA